MKKNYFYSDNVKNMVNELDKNAKQNWRKALDNFNIVVTRVELTGFKVHS